MFILGSNSAGLLNKKESFIRNISLFNPGVYFVQETKVPRKGKLKISDYIIFEDVRKSGGGGEFVEKMQFEKKGEIIRMENYRKIKGEFFRKITRISKITIAT